jgi:N utilization substance protein B
MGYRRKARQIALQGLYIQELRQVGVEDLKNLDWLEDKISDDEERFFQSIITGVIENQDTLDTMIEKHSRNWKLERMTIIDKLLLRMAIFELLYLDDIPSAVTIDEAIELGKEFSGDHAGQFLNGILDAVNKKESKPEED